MNTQTQKQFEELATEYISAYQYKNYNIHRINLKPSYYDDFINFFKSMKKMELIAFCEHYDIKYKKTYNKDFLIDIIFHDYFDIWLSDINECIN